MVPWLSIDLGPLSAHPAATAWPVARKAVLLTRQHDVCVVVKLPSLLDELTVSTLALRTPTENSENYRYELMYEVRAMAQEHELMHELMYEERALPIM